MRDRPFLTGLDSLLAAPASLRGKKIGLLANAASVSAGFVPAARALAAAGLDIVRLFGPEHGLSGAAQDMEPVKPKELEGRSSIPIVSLYGERFEDLSPRPEQLDGLDAIVSDLPDVGSRYYTFVWTTALMMKACAARGIPLFVLDRPNPLGGEILEGNLPDDDRLLSFVGLYPVPVRHGMTPGEMAQYVNSAFRVGCDLHVIPMLEGTRPPWVLPSPNMPTPETALVYPGGCLFEGTNLSEGRGTTRPFEIVGAPWLDADAAADAANALNLPGVVFRPHVFKPTFQKHAGLLCGGVQLHVTESLHFRPYETGLRLVQCLRDLQPSHFVWRTERYEYRDDVPAIDLLSGTSRYRALVDAGSSLDSWISSFRLDEARFAAARRPSLLYGQAGGPATFLVVGAHESGKTTLMVKLISGLVAEGLTVASIKHTDHEYETDLPGKDSSRHAEAGANPALLVAGRRAARHWREERPQGLDPLLTAEARGVDVILVEGFRRSSLPKIEVVRAATGRAPVALDDPSVVGVVTDVATAHDPSIPRFGPEDFDSVLALVKKTMGLLS